ncbi:MAG: AAA family ATPase [Actinomycetota bacterium]|nr:AAA family ATPase [Actinomycetota bacterium]
MRLIKLRLKQFRRFAAEQSLDVNEDLIALVGPNEAGKSSVLAAIDLLGREARPDQADVTRGQSGPASITGVFVLEDEDRALLSNIHQGPDVTHLWVELRQGADRNIWRPDPRPTRDLGPRRRCQQLAAALEGHPALDAQYSSDEEAQWDPQLWVDVSSHLASDDESFPDETVQSLEALALRLRGLEFPAEPKSEDEESEQQDEAASSGQDEGDDEDEVAREAREATASALVELASIERRPTPVRQVLEALSGRLPDVAFFAEEDRELERDYLVADVAAAPPPALANLCALADLDLADVQSSLGAGRVPHVEKLFEEANRNLKERFQATWSQSKVYPRLSTPSDGVLRILIATEGDADYSYPQERSDGLRWFMALHALLAARGAREPILLVDEAETHLHYDAQADLVDALMSQRIASKVIYTTHSVGCLPPDLGCGIRVVLAEEGAERSRIVNSYWSVVPEEDDKIGYTPLLLAMGARMLALTIPRYGIITEGPSDAVLLPSLLREAAATSRLPYRVVPGLAELAEDRVDSVHHHAGKVLCLTDDDEGGEAIRAKLVAGGVSDDTIFSLGRIASGYTLEDLVRAELFASAVNQELDTWGLGPMRVDAAQVPTTRRWPWLLAQGASTSTPIEKLSKARVAQRIVDAGRADEPVAEAALRLEPTVNDSVRALHEAFVSALGLQPN